MFSCSDTWRGHFQFEIPSGIVCKSAVHVRGISGTYEVVGDINVFLHDDDSENSSHKIMDAK